MTPEETQQAQLNTLRGIIQNTQNTAELLARLLLLLEAATGFRAIPQTISPRSGPILPPGAQIPGDDRACRVCGCTDDHKCPGGCSWVEEDLCSSCTDKLRTCRECGGTEFGIGYLGRTWVKEDLCSDCAHKLEALSTAAPIP